MKIKDTQNVVVTYKLMGFLDHIKCLEQSKSFYLTFVHIIFFTSPSYTFLRNLCGYLLNDQRLGRGNNFFFFFARIVFYSFNGLLGF